jgi:hypothetical protein
VVNPSREYKASGIRYQGGIQHRRCLLGMDVEGFLRSISTQPAAESDRSAMLN